MLLKAVRWIFFSVLLSLAHIWIQCIQGILDPKQSVFHYIFEADLNWGGNLMVFAFVMVATSLGSDYYVIARAYPGWPQTLAMMFGISIFVISITMYVMAAATTHRLDARTVLPVALSAIVYGFACNLLVSRVYTSLDAVDREVTKEEGQ